MFWTRNKTSRDKAAGSEAYVALERPGTPSRIVSLSVLVRDLMSLTKPRLSLLVILTAACGMAVAPGPRDFAMLLVALLGTSLIVGSANALNCYLERDLDGYMERTRDRPLVTGRLSGAAALAWGVALFAVGLLLLQRSTNPLTVFLGILAFALYLGVYTPMKRHSMLALFAGAVPGALPPMMGWTSVTGQAETGAWILFAILFFWQLPHFIAISLFRQREYERAGLKTLPGTLGSLPAKQQMVIYASLVSIVSLLPYPLGLAGFRYFLVTFVVGAVFSAAALAGLLNVRDLNWSRIVFFGSLAYLPVVLVAWVLS
jgi:protoheme IX farnesyltransferase